ncbi:MAG: SIR2 family protein [Parvibaculum sp.]|uniref:SIR2 family protein n=1 Tax=Parvibaculum sp. TaxID=2024848 RepID=UPI00283C6D92|nr:SIR2 family protein [Parvibaculum sp.]MDR3500917.1 SIR2 family protein [Parvibaculum sp.]
MNKRNPLFLLGAGASKPAGVPLAGEMTLEMIRRCDANRRSELGKTIRAIEGALRMQSGVVDSFHGEAVNIESILNAAEMLGDRFSLELAPFVAAWHPIIEALEATRLSSFEAESIGRRAGGRLHFPSGPRVAQRSQHSNESDIRSTFSNALAGALLDLSSRLQRRPDGSLFRTLKAFLTGELARITLLNDPLPLAYLDSLLELGRSRPVHIATLNYDNSIELRAQALGIPCSTGIADWVNNASFAAPQNEPGIDLIKLHGSVRWLWAKPKSDLPAGFEDRIVTEVGDDVMKASLDGTPLVFPSETIGNQMAVIFGGRNKLTAEGPFLDLLIKFKALLVQTDELIVVGYSFRDPHVNHCILRWLGATGRKSRLIVVEHTEVALDDVAFLKLIQKTTPGQLDFQPIGAEAGMRLSAN